MSPSLFQDVQIQRLYVRVFSGTMHRRTALLFLHTLFGEYRNSISPVKTSTPGRSIRIGVRLNFKLVIQIVVELVGQSTLKTSLHTLKNLSSILSPVELMVYLPKGGECCYAGLEKNRLT